MSVAPESASLPPAITLSRPAQMRALGIAAVAVLGIVMVVVLFRWITQPAPVVVKLLPPGMLQLTSAQIAGLKIEPARTSDSADVTTATGTITVDETQSTPVFLPYSGQVTQVFVDAGSRVVRGQPLLRIKTSDIVDARNALFSAMAQHQAAASQVRIAQANVQRQAEIFKTAGGALKDYQQAQNDLVTAQSARRTADSALGAARDKLAIFGKTSDEIGRLERADGITGIHAETVLHAPIAGIIAARSVSAGQYVTSGGDKPVLTIANPSRVWLIAQLAESDAALVHVGDPVTVTTSAYPRRIFEATVDNVAAALDPVTHRLPVRASIANADGALKPQMFASFAIRRPGNGGSALTVPANAVIHEGDTARIWIDRGKGLLQARTVQVGDSRDGLVKILGGIEPGARVVTSGAIFVNEAGLGE